MKLIVVFNEPLAIFLDIAKPNGLTKETGNIILINYCQWFSHNIYFQATATKEIIQYKRKYKQISQLAFT